MKRKLIEVALPLEAISVASRRDKDRSVGTIKNVHKWFAPMPTPAWRALLFASIVDDPGEGPGRDRLLDLVTRLVPADGLPPADAVLDEARKVMEASGPLPTVFDPFCGGGSTLVEAQRLGLPAAGSDLNPVPVLITKVLCELLPQVVEAGAVSPNGMLPGTGGRLAGFFVDLNHYAERVRDRAWSTVQQFFLPLSTTGAKVAWLWARTIQCPNPACSTTIPLYTSPWVSKKAGSERWLRPVIDGQTIRFEIGKGAGPPPSATKVGVRGARFRCLACKEIAPEDHIRSEAQAGRMGVQPLAVVVDRPGAGRDYEPPGDAEQAAKRLLRPDGIGDVDLPSRALGFRVQLYGMVTQADLYTARQLHTLAAFSDAVAEVPAWVLADGGRSEYANAVAAVLALCVGKLSQVNSTQVRWHTRNGPSHSMPAFGRHAMPMVWDFAEANAFGGSMGSWTLVVASLIDGLLTLPEAPKPASVKQADVRDAARAIHARSALVATDPPYFAHIGYADLSDYFYIWHRRALGGVFPSLYATISTPKEAELIASPFRHDGDSERALNSFIDGYTEAFRELAKTSRSDLPMIVVYAHRQEETDGGGLTSTGWDAMLEALLAGGLGVVGTWPLHATRTTRQIGLGTNALASYIVLVCRPRLAEAGITDRQGFARALRSELPDAIRALQDADTLPFDLTQAAIGPGMAIFSRFARVVEPNGAPMRVRTAISLINQVRSAVLSEQDDEFDAETRWAIQWFERFGFDTGPFGEAEKLFTATATSFDGLKRTGIVESRASSVWLLDPQALPAEWDPVAEVESTWEVMMHLLRALHYGGGEVPAAALLNKVDRFGDLARDLAYRLADICETTKRATTALAVNGLIASWPEITQLAARGRDQSQGTLL